LINETFNFISYFYHYIETTSNRFIFAGSHDGDTENLTNNSQKFFGTVKNKNYFAVSEVSPTKFLPCSFGTLAIYVAIRFENPIGHTIHWFFV